MASTVAVPRSTARAFHWPSAANVAMWGLTIFVAFLVLEGLHAQNLFEIGALTQEDQDRVLVFLRKFLDEDPSTLAT